MINRSQLGRTTDMGLAIVKQKSLKDKQGKDVKTKKGKSVLTKETEIVNNKSLMKNLGLDKQGKKSGPKGGRQALKPGGKVGLKKVDKSKNPGLAKLPMKVRNNMGYAKKGGLAMKKNGKKLKGNQNKLDANKDGKISKADFVLLKKKKKKKTKSA